MKSFLYALALALLTLTLTAQAAAPRVLASIKPVQYLVAAAMEGIGAPDLLLPSTASPHDYSLRPSNVRTIKEADIVFWIGEPMEFFLAKLLANTGTPQIALIETPELTLLPLRQAGLWLEKDVEDHDHHHVGIDPHVWLNPGNAALMVSRIGAALGAIDPSNAERYQANAARFQERLGILNTDFQAQLESVRNTPYIVFHDGYQYLEEHYGLHAAGAIILSPERPPGARRIQEIRDYIRTEKVRCVFSEPQFESRLVQVLVEDSDIRTAVLDSLGMTLPAEPDSYFKLLTQLVESLAQCLRPSGQ